MVLVVVFVGIVVGEEVDLSFEATVDGQMDAPAKFN